MAIATYAELQEAVRNWLHRGDLAARIPEFITLGEARLNRALQLPFLFASLSFSPSLSARTLALPADYMALRGIYDDNGAALLQLSARDMAAAGSASAGRPEYYAIGAEITFERAADQTYLFTLDYRARLDIAADGTNTLIQRHPDIYLYSSLLGAEPYLRRDERVQVWAELLRAAIDEAHRVEKSRTIRRTELVADGVYDITVG